MVHAISYGGKSASWSVNWFLAENTFSPKYFWRVSDRKWYSVQNSFSTKINMWMELGHVRNATRAAQVLPADLSVEISPSAARSSFQCVLAVEPAVARCLSDRFLLPRFLWVPEKHHTISRKYKPSTALALPASLLRTPAPYETAQATLDRM